MLALNLYTSPSNNGGIVLYLDVDLGHMHEDKLLTGPYDHALEEYFGGCENFLFIHPMLLMYIRHYRLVIVLRSHYWLNSN